VHRQEDKLSTSSIVWKPARERLEAEPDQRRSRASESARRLRIEVPGLYGDEARGRRIEQRLAALAGVTEVTASARTGRILVRLDPFTRSEDEVTAAALAEADPDARAAPTVRGVIEGLRERASAAKEIVRREVRRREGGGDAIEVREKDEDEVRFHALGAEEVARALEVNPALGLDAVVAEARRLEHGENVLAGIEPRSSLAIVAGQALTVPTAILAGAAWMSAMLGDVAEALAVGGVVGINVAIGYFTERRAEELLHAWGELRVEHARVLRGGQIARIPAAQVVPGDVLVLTAGDAVAADARVIEEDDLACDESTLTGESEPADKTVASVPEDAPVADRDDMVFAGTVVAQGRGRAIVTATGERTELGAIRRALSSASARSAPLERQLGELGRRLAGLSALAAGGVVGLGLLRGRALSDVARSAVALGVAAIPEGIPTAGTTALALASRRLFRRGIVIRKLAAAETLGAVSAVCADKTGTLTLNRMRVEAIFLAGEGEIAVSWPDPARPSLARADGAPLDPRRVRDLARVLALNADVELGDDGGVKRGSGTERALAELSLGVGFPVSGARRRARRVREERRSALRPFMITVHEDPELGRIALVKGAPEEVAALCDLPDGGAEVRRENEAMASRGLRVLACAWRRRPGETYDFLGLVGLRDPPRAGVAEAIAALSRAGVRTYMLTGDQDHTAKAIAASLGIDEDAVYARVTPDAKVLVVRDLEERGHVVAMTGDGVNDGPALRAADVGIAMGRGTDIARAVADVVLARDDLSSIAEAVVEGRRLYDNVRRAIDYLVATNMSEVLVMILGGLAGSGPLSPLQLLWLNMITDVVPALALATEPAAPDVMDRPPRDPDAVLFGSADYLRLGRSALGMAGASLGAYLLGTRLDGASPQGMAFTSLLVAQLFHTRACRAGIAAPNPMLDRALAGSFGLQLFALASPPMRRALAVGAAGPVPLVLAALIGALPAASRAMRARDEIVIARAPREAKEIDS
jgi:Ca2+-transporting ATPase